MVTGGERTENEGSETTTERERIMTVERERKNKGRTNIYKWKRTSMIEGRKV